MKDRILLLLAGAACAAFAAVFWRIFGIDGFAIIMSITVYVLGADNARLRRELRDRNESRGP
jgi:hypothetical protein